MTKVLVTESYLDNIADAIRAKLGTPAEFKPSQMATAIGQIQVASLETKSITANGTYTPSTGKDGFSEVTVNVPNSYVAGDEGKVVSSGALVAQTARSSQITINGTYDTTTNNSVTVNVSGGGGEDPFALNNYIESSGTQYVNTGYYVTDTSRFEVIAEVPQTNGRWPSPFGTRNADNVAEIMWWYKWNNGNEIGFNWIGGRTTLYSGTAYYGCKSKVVLSKTKAFIESENGNVDAKTISGSTVTSSYPLYLFSVDQGGSDGGSNVHCTMKLYRFRIYEGDALVHEYVPWVDGSDVACLKDTVSGNLFYNSGSGTFTYGTDGVTA